MARHIRQFEQYAARCGDLLLISAAVGLIGTAGLLVYATSAYRAFSTNGYWNTPFETNAPIDPNSAYYIADSQDPTHSQNYLKFTVGNSFAEPIYFASGADPLYSITVGSNTVQVHIPAGATPASGSDAQMTVYDLTSGYNKVVGLHGSTYTNGQFNANGIDSYSLSSNGLEGSAAGADDTSNFGHRGVSSATRAVRLDEIQAGAINHRIECFWWATAAAHYWPMVGHENNKGGNVPEGIVIRIKPSLDLNTMGLSSAARIVATALQQYGCIVGDNSGSGNRLKLQANVDWTGILNTDSLQPLTWNNWEFVQGGATPHGTPVADPTPPPTDGGGSSGGGSNSGGSDGSGGSTSGGSTSGGTGENAADGSSGGGEDSLASDSIPGEADSAADSSAASDAATPISGALSVGKGALKSTVTQSVGTIFSKNTSTKQRVKAGMRLSGVSMVTLSIGFLAVYYSRRLARHLRGTGWHTPYVA